MSLFGPDNFAYVLFALMKAGGEWSKARTESKLLKNEKFQGLGQLLENQLREAMPAQDADLSIASLEVTVRSPQARLWIARTAAQLGFFSAGAEFEGTVVLLDAATRKVIDNSHPAPQINNEDSFLKVTRRILIAQHAAQDEAADQQRAFAEIQLKQFADDFKTGKIRKANPWAMFTHNMLNFSLELLAEQPEILGGGKKVQKVLTVVLPTLSQAYSPKTGFSEAAAALPSMFARSAINTLVERPELLSSELRWQRIVTGVLTPLQQKMAEDPKGVMSLVAEGRLKDLLQGELAPIALKIISTNSNDYFKGGLADDRIAGVVLRSTLADYVSADDGARKLRTLFGAEGIERVVLHTLTAAKDTPQLFIRENAKSVKDDTLRKYLSAVADCFVENGSLVAFDSGLAAELYCIGIDAVAANFLERVKVGPNSSLQGHLGAEVAAFVIRDIVTGLKSAAANGLPASRAVATLQQKLGSDKLGSIIRIVADYATRSPHLLLGESTNPVVVNVAKMIAEAILADENGLLSSEDWREIMLATIEAAIGNPNTLFARPGAGETEQMVSDLLIRTILRKAIDANRQSQSGLPASVLFGPILREAIIATLDAASTGVLNVLKEQQHIKARIDAVETLIDRINGLAMSHDPALIIGSREWIKIYTMCIAEVLHSGPAALGNLTPTALLLLIRSGSTITTPQEGMG